MWETYNGHWGLENTSSSSDWGHSKCHYNSSSHFPHTCCVLGTLHTDPSYYVNFPFPAAPPHGATMMSRMLSWRHQG